MTRSTLQLKYLKKTETMETCVNINGNTIFAQISNEKIDL